MYIIHMCQSPLACRYMLTLCICCSCIGLQSEIRKELPLLLPRELRSLWYMGLCIHSATLCIMHYLANCSLHWLYMQLLCKDLTGKDYLPQIVRKTALPWHYPNKVHVHCTNTFEWLKRTKNAPYGPVPSWKQWARVWRLMYMYMLIASPCTCNTQHNVHVHTCAAAN